MFGGLMSCVLKSGGANVRWAKVLETQPIYQYGWIIFVSYFFDEDWSFRKRKTINYHIFPFSMQCL